MTPEPIYHAKPYACAIETAMRRGEIAALRRDHLDLERCIAHLPETKNGDARDVPLSPRAVAELCGMPSRLDGWVFGPPKAAAEAMTHGFAELCDALGIEGLRFHDLRREATSRLFERGFTIAEVREVTGHKTLSQLARYTRGRAEEIARKLAA